MPLESHTVAHVTFLLATAVLESDCFKCRFSISEGTKGRFCQVGGSHASEEEASSPQESQASPLIGNEGRCLGSSQRPASSRWGYRLAPLLDAATGAQTDGVICMWTQGQRTESEILCLPVNSIEKAGASGGEDSPSREIFISQVSAVTPRRVGTFRAVE